ncbi:hypothetical protein GOB42_15110 [Sinorhizobium meliloti]|nr:hypothetical protein [Sinorhizobium meliloti]PII38694.1 hypothetical protein T190_17085 [Sinorhizobium meliloti CCBAU 01290]
MTAGIPQFEISNFHNDPTQPRLWWAEVRVNFDEMIDDIDVTQWVTIRVRITADEPLTVQELREKLHRKAAETLRLAVQHVEGKSAQELLDAAHQRNEQEASQIRYS